MVKSEKHILEIANCPNFKNCEGTPCEKIVKSQNLETRQIPEPYNGNINNCKLLFISSNPSISEKEIYPTSEWNEADIIDFFENRFSKESEYVKDFIYPKHNDGYAINGVKFWIHIRKMASTLLGTNNAIPGKDYSIMEIVRCKSRNEIGVDEATKTCSDKYLNQTLAISNANIIIAIGAKSRNELEKKLKIKLNKGEIIKKKIGSKERLIFTIPHPASRQIRKPEKIFTKEELQKIINYTINAS
ncbi:uracil-DNA glycosylase family protein [Christiangramia sp. LLG6405-1]|uniref:uracil-DNA glycosylase family protein n=1 Tax=Christiangramia sp. LLG6405-1 TaxID=3160832 RepID=UPI003866B131